MLALGHEIAAAIAEVFGEPGTYLSDETGEEFALPVISRREMRQPVQGMERAVQEVITTLTIRAADFTGRGRPMKGDSVTVDGVEYKILAIDSDNGYVLILKARRLAA